MNLYLFLIKKEDVTVNAEKSQKLEAYLATEKADRVVEKSEIKTNDFIKNLSKDFGLKTLKKFPTMEECLQLSEENIDQYFDIPTEHNNDEDKKLIANNLRDLTLEYLKVDPQGKFKENISLSVLSTKKQTKEKEYQKNARVAEIYSKISKKEFESGTLKLGSLAGKETAEGVECTIKALVAFISDEYKGSIE